MSEKPTYPQITERMLISTAPPPRSGFAVVSAFFGLGLILFGLYGTSHEILPYTVGVASGVGLALLCFGLSILFGSRPPASIEIDPTESVLRLGESMFVATMPSVSIPFADILSVDFDSESRNKEHVLDVRFRDAGRVILPLLRNEVRSERLEGLVFERSEEPEIGAPMRVYAKNDPTVPLLREYVEGTEAVCLWRPRSFTRAARFRLLGVLGLGLATWALSEMLPLVAFGAIMAVLAVGALFFVVQIAKVQRREFSLELREGRLRIRKERAAVFDLDRSRLRGFSVELGPDEAERTLAVHHAEGTDRVSIGNLAYAEAIGLCARFNQLLQDEGVE